MAKLIPSIAFIVNITLGLFVATLWIKNLKYALHPQLSTPQQTQSPIITNHALQSDTLYTSYNWLVQQFRTNARELLQIQSAEKIIMLLATYLFLHFIVKSLMQTLAEYFPKLNYAKTIKCLNNIVDSMLLFSLILGFIIAAMFITNYQIDQSVLKNPNDVNNSQLVEGKYSKTLIFLLLETFLYGRILFSVGYLFGTFINMESFRTLGVTLSIVSIVIGLSSIYGFDIFNYF